MTDLLAGLWSLAEREAKERGGNAKSLFDPIGLILYEPLAHGGFDSTPMNSLAFATTGGDGVHYSFLTSGSRALKESPIVMTVPMMSERPNVIVGENLREFLCLGCTIGYFCLEQLVYDVYETIHDINNPSNIPQDQDQAYLLGVLKREFNLHPWPELESRLKYLQKQFLPEMRFSENFTYLGESIL